MLKENNSFRPIEQPKKPYEQLGQMVKEVAAVTNLDVMKNFGVQNLLSSDATIRTDQFHEDNGGIYNSIQIARHEAEVRKIELGFTNAENPKVATYYKEKYGCNNETEIIDQWKKQKTEGASGMFEQAILILLHKFLKDEFVVVRTASYDDYKAGIDNLIINKETGDVICALDEVHDSAQGKYRKEKNDKVQKIAESGGRSVAYGLTIEDKKIKQTRINNVPVFALGMDSKRFESFLPILLKSGLGEPSRAEKIVMTELITSLTNQLATIPGNQKIASNLEKFRASLWKIKELLEDDLEKHN